MRSHWSKYGENYVHVSFADISKGFDLINHNVLITELELLGVHICLRNWIGAFLTSRRQRVTINGIVSHPVFQYGGIPQGTRLPSLLFTLLVSRLVRDWPYRVKYVDDAVVCKLISRCSPSCLPYYASDNCHFAAERSVRFNPKRCGELLINILQFQPAPVSELQLIVSANKRVHNQKILGLNVSDNLIWNTHIAYLFKKANKRLYALCILEKSGFPVDDLVKIFCALIRSVLKYAPRVWAALPEYLHNVIESVQRKAQRIMLPHLSLALRPFSKPRNNLSRSVGRKHAANFFYDHNTKNP